MSSVLPERSPLLQNPSQESQASRASAFVQKKKEVTHFMGALDQGTTSTRFIIFNNLGQLVASASQQLTNIYRNDGWHEQDPEDILDDAQKCMELALQNFTAQGFKRNQICSIGITNQRETTVVWDRKNGRSIGKTIVWSDVRTRDLVRELRAQENSDMFRERCGMQLSTYPAAVKLRWLIENDSVVAECYGRGDLCFGTIDSWLVYCLNGRKNNGNPVYATDPTNASRTLFMDLKTRNYADDLIEFFSIDKSKVTFPKICPSSCPTSYGKIRSGPLRGCRITGVLGDQSAALVGHRGFRSGDAKSTYGTGCFLLYNVGETPTISKNGLVSTVAYDFGKHGCSYALEGSIAVAGSGLNWTANFLGHDSASDMIDAFNKSADNGGVYFVTAFSGLFAPYWTDDARATIFGITQATKPDHIIRAAIESICFQNKAILDAMAADSGYPLQTLAVDGGVTNSHLIMQIQADISRLSVNIPEMNETTAFGAAIAAGLALNVWDSLDDVAWTCRNANDHRLDPQMEEHRRRVLYQKWTQAVHMSIGWTSGTYHIRDSKTGELTQANVAAMLAAEDDMPHTFPEAIAEESDDEDGLQLGGTRARAKTITQQRIKLPLGRVQSSHALSRIQSQVAISRAASGQNLTAMLREPCCIRTTCRHGSRPESDQANHLQKSCDTLISQLEAPEKGWATTKVLTYIAFAQLFIIFVLILLFFYAMNGRALSMGEL